MNNKTNSSLSEIRDEYNSISEKINEKEKPNKGKFKMKLSELWTDKRKMKLRVIISFLASFAFAFTFFIFGPFELYISNMSYMTFPITALIRPCLLLGILIFLVLFEILILLRGKIFNYVLSSLFAVTVAGYVQGNFLNVDHGSLDGAAIDWAAFTLPTVFNLLFWIFVFVAVFVLLYFSRKIWTRTIQIVCVLIIGAQIVALCSLLLTTEFKKTDDKGYLSNSTIYEVSPENNVIVFLLDRFDNSYADVQLNKDPAIAEKLAGFTYYKNFTGSYTRTYPSVNYLLTGVYCDYSIPTDEYVKKAWSEGKFLPDIKNAGFQSKIYTEKEYVYFDIDNLRGKVDNIGEATRTVDYGMMMEYMYNLSAYRYAPETLKPFFWFYTGDLANIATLDDNSDSIHKTDDVAFYANLRDKGVSIKENSKGSFIFYHLSGSHDPFTMNEFGDRVSGLGWSEGIYQQTKGNLNMIFEYIEQLKKLGVYDDTTIIITADHGFTGTLEKLDYDRMLSLFIKPAGGDASKPLEYSYKQICQDNLRASIVSYFGLSTEGYARTIEDIGENEDVKRYFYMSGSDPEKKHRDVNLVTYEIIGDANKFSNWELISTLPIKYPYYDAN